MKYRLTCLTPLLIGDGSRLSPIDYMVWKDHVNVLDQARIFRLLAKGPRLDNYLKQIRLADKLDFASWGGFAQSFAQRRVPFEYAGCTAFWDKLRAEDLHIPTFVTGPGGPFVPGSALKGALRTGLVFNSRGSEAAFKDIAAQLSKDRPLRQPGQRLEAAAIGASGNNRLKVIAPSDSNPLAESPLKIYLIRVASLEKKTQDRNELRWRLSPRGTVDSSHPEDSTPLFAEMASPGTAFEGDWTERPFYRQPETVKALRWKEPLNTEDILNAANSYASAMLEVHLQYAQKSGLNLLEDSIRQLEARLSEARQSGSACLLSLGWGGGFLSKVASLDTSDDSYRQILSELSIYSKAIRTGMPFPKTRRVVFLENKPATLPGWALLEVQ